MQIWAHWDGARAELRVAEKSLSSEGGDDLNLKRSIDRCETFPTACSRHVHFAILICADEIEINVLPALGILLNHKAEKKSFEN